MAASHFSLLQFLSHQRGGLPERLSNRLAKHLHEDCPSCTGDLRFVQRLAEVARRDRMATPPAFVLARALALFQPAARTAGQPVSPAASLARLLFDSFLQPAPAGVRGPMRFDRHLVFADRELLLDVHLEPEQEAEQQSITGQVQSTSMSEDQLTGLPVMLVEGQRVLMSTHTNRRGEFVFGAAPRREVALFVVCRDRVVKIPSLPPPAAE